MKRQTKYFIFGLLVLICAVFCTTFLPLIVKNCFYKINVENYIYFEIEFLLLVLGGVLFLFSPKYYKFQMLSIALLMIFYEIFIKIYPYILSLFKG